MGALGTWLVSLATPFISKILLALGVGIASYAAVSFALTAAIGSAKAAFAGFTGDGLALVQLSGMSEAIGIVCGAMVARVSLAAVKKLEVLR